MIPLVNLPLVSHIGKKITNFISRFQRFSLFWVLSSVCPVPSRIY